MPLQGVIWVGQDQEPVPSYIPLCLRKKMCQAGMLSWVNIVEFRAFGILRRQKLCINCLASFQNSYHATVSGGSYQWSTIMPKRMINKDSVLNCFTKDQDLKTPSQPNKHQPIIAVLVKSFSSSYGLRNAFTACLSKETICCKSRPWFGFQFSASLLLLILAAWELQNLDMWEEKGVPVLEIAFTWLGYVLLSPL